VSKRIKVNPDHYKLAGRERPGDAQAARAKAARSIRTAKAQNRWTARTAAKKR
jgi:hypothetical protein